MPRTYQDLIVEHREHVARITINRPKSYNAFTGDTQRELTLAIEEAGADPTIGVIVLTGAGDKAFCAGGDVAWEKNAGKDRTILEPYNLHVTISRCPKPVIARVNGYAIGGGNHLAYYCDFTIAADTAIFGQNGPRVGSPPGSPVVSYLARVIGHKRAREMWMLCRKYNAQQAMEWGLVNAVVPMDQLDAEVQKWCDEILSLSPTCLRVIKAAFVGEFETILGQADVHRRHLVAPDFWSTEQKEGTTAYAEKRKADFKQFLR
ncbi:MAG: enoyl-CoA hydratase/isomerase family protein [Rhizobacter sp.]|nr:enoyl-CoA hydratase/isomerase family protein [Rhizobacter sp.]